MDDDPWATDIPNRYQPGQLVKGKVTKITNFGVFVGLEDGLEGLLHISELADHKVENPEDVVKVGDEIEVKILRVDADERKIGLSRKRVEWAEDEIGRGSDEAADGRRRRSSRRAQGRRRLRHGPALQVGASADRIRQMRPQADQRTAQAAATPLSDMRCPQPDCYNSTSLRRNGSVATRRAVFFVTARTRRTFRALRRILPNVQMLACRQSMERC